MSDDYQVRKDIDKLIGSVYNLENGDESFYTKTETNDLLHSTYYDKDETEDLLDTKIDTDTVYTKTESDNRYQQKSTGLTLVKERVWSDTINLTYRLYVDEVNRQCTVTIAGSNISIPSGLANYEVTNFVPTEYQSKGNKFFEVARTNNFRGYMWPSGTIGISNFASTTATGQSFNGEIDWNY